VRIPAALNGLVGLKPTYGAIPLDGVVPLATSLDSVGPLVRTVEDALLLVAAMAGEPTPALEGMPSVAGRASRHWRASSSRTASSRTS